MGAEDVVFVWGLLTDAESRGNALYYAALAVLDESDTGLDGALEKLAEACEQYRQGL